MLARRAASAARALAGSQGAPLANGFARQTAWGEPSAAAAAAWAPPAANGLRWHSSGDVARPRGPEEEDYHYEAPFGVAVGRVKKLSLFSCACAVGAGPIILGLDAGTTLSAKTGIVATLASFGVFTTGLLTWFTQPYVQRLRYEPPTGTVEVTTLSLLAQPRVDRFHLDEVREADSVHPLASFAVRGRSYYVDSQTFPNKALLARLVPQAAAAATMAAATAEQQQQQQEQQQQHGGEQRPPPPQ